MITQKELVNKSHLDEKKIFYLLMIQKYINSKQKLLK